MNASNSHTSGQSCTSLRIRSTACVVFRPGFRQQPKSLVQALDGFLAEAAPFQSDFVFAEYFRFSRAHRHRIRQHVLGHHAIAADKRVLPDPAKLMHAAEGLNHRPIFHDDVPGERNRVSELRVVADPHIVRHVRVGHQQIVVADLGDQPAALPCRDEC